MTDLSILIPSRNEQFLSRTIEDILANIEGNTDIICVLDGQWAHPPIADHPRVTLIYHPQPIGQRAATNEAARISTAKYVMKVDAHCAFDKGFDVKLMADCDYDWTVIPRLYNLRAFDWKCQACGHQMDQGPYPDKCEKCESTGHPSTGSGYKFEQVIIWEPKWRKMTDYTWFDRDLKYHYFDNNTMKLFGDDTEALKLKYDHKHRAWAQGEITDQMTALGACFFMHRERYWELGGLDERHGSWGQMGVEIACKSQLSGGRQVVNKKTWYSHLFRTQEGFGFPYPNPGISQARNHSHWLWLGNNWEGAVRPLSWILEKYWPIPDWTEEDLERIKKNDANIKTNVAKETGTLHRREVSFGDGVGSNLPGNANNIGGRDRLEMDSSLAAAQPSIDAGRVTPGIRANSNILPTKSIIYYTDCRLDPAIMTAVQNQIARSINGHELISVSLKPIDFGQNITLEAERGPLTMFRQILAGLEASSADIVFLCEHDILYHSSHFDFVPPDRTKIWYNTNVWHLRASDGHAVYYTAKRLSQLCAYRDVLLEHYRRRVAKVEAEGFSYRMGFEPGTHNRAERVDDLQSDTWRSLHPNVDIKHGKNLTPARWSVDKFRDKRNCRDWTEAGTIPYWGQTAGRFDEFLQTLQTSR